MEGKENGILFIPEGKYLSIKSPKISAYNVETKEDGKLVQICEDCSDISGVKDLGQLLVNEESSFIRLDYCKHFELPTAKLKQTNTHFVQDKCTFSSEGEKPCGLIGKIETLGFESEEDMTSKGYWQRVCVGEGFNPDKLRRNFVVSVGEGYRGDSIFSCPELSRPQKK